MAKSTTKEAQHRLAQIYGNQYGVVCQLYIRHYFRF